MIILENFKTLKKEKGEWKLIGYKNEEVEVYESLMHDLIAKKLEHCTYITRIQRIQKYNGFIEIIVTFTGDIRRIYTIKSH